MYRLQLDVFLAHCMAQLLVQLVQNCSSPNINVNMSGMS